MKRIIVFCCLIFLAFPLITFGKIGVGVGTGKIEIEEELKPGGIYNLPPLVVYNTGDEPADYEVSIAFHSNIPQKSPDKEWFYFNPKTFHLDSTGTQTVEIAVNLPLKAEPGDYFCYAEARPIDKTVEHGGAKIGVAAAAKVYFTVEPANIWQAAYYKAIYFWKFYAPWTYVAAIVILMATIIVTFRRFFTFNFGIGRKRMEDRFYQQQEEERPLPEGDFSKEKVLRKVLKDVEKYTAKLSERKVEELFHEANMNRFSVDDFFRNDDYEFLRRVSPELENVLLLLKKGLNKLKKKNIAAYYDCVDTVISGLTGE